MERTDWLDGGFDPFEARFLMVTAITHHQFSSPIWGEDEVRKLHAELAEIELLASRAVMDRPPMPPPDYSGYPQCGGIAPAATLASCAAC